MNRLAWRLPPRVLAVRSVAPTQGRCVVSIRSLSAVLCLVASVSVPAHAVQSGQPPAPPVDQSEGGGATGNVPMRLGSALVSGSLWIEGARTTGDVEHETADTLRLRRARLGLAGSLNGRVGWSVAGELTAQPALRNAFILVKVANQLSVRLGQANPMTALERGSSPTALELIDRSPVTNELTGAADIGVTLFNPAPYKGWLGYALNITNGAGFNEPDDNDAKDVSGRLVLTAPMLEGLQMVVSGTRGEQPLGLRTRSSVGVEYRSETWRVMAEHLRQVRDNLPASDGYFGMVAFRYRPGQVSPSFAMLEVAARFSVLNDRATAAGVPSGAANDDGSDPVLTEQGIVTTRVFQAGVNYYVNPNMRLMGNVVVPVDERKHPGPAALMRLQLLF